MSEDKIMKKRLVFTVVTARASAAEQRQLLDGIISQAFRMGIDIAVISNIYNASEFNSFITHENSIYRIVKSEKHDGIIFTYDSFMNPELREEVLRLIGENNIPVVNIGSGTPQYFSVNSDTGNDIKQITDHFIDVHGFSDIDFITGPVDNAEALRRVDGYKKSLFEHGIAFCKENIIYGDFWTFSGERIALEYINKKRRLPQAIVCANDYMAYALCDTLVSHGINIPEEVSVAGYEYIGERTEHYPVLTTYQRNREALGKQAVLMLYDIVNGSSSGYSINTEGFLVPGDTCSCGADHRQIAFEVSEKKKQTYYASLNDTGMLEQFLTESGSVPDLISALNRHSYFIPDLSGLYLCLYDDWCVSSDIKRNNETETEDTVCYTISDIYVNNAPPVHFRSRNMFPDEIQNAEIPNAYYCCPVFFMDEDFGYMIVRYDKVRCFGESFRNWNKIAANALEFLRMKNDIDYLMRCQNLSEFRDSVTGLNNRKGFMNEIRIAVRNTDQNQFVLAAVRLTAAGTRISGESGRYESDSSVISSVSDIIRSISSEQGMICGRIDRNTFAVFVLISDPTEYTAIIREKINIHLYGFFSKSGLYGDDMYSFCEKKGLTDEGNIDILLDDICNGLSLENDAIVQKNELPEYSEYRKLRSRIYSSPEISVTAEEACRMLCLSSGHFRAMYKKIFGISFHQDCMFMRTRLSGYLLVSTKMNIASVAEKSGFDNEKYFMQQFRKITGYTPGEYRELFG